jgi:hypothetical protein
MKPQWWVNCKPLADEAMKVCLRRPFTRSEQDLFTRLRHSLENTRRRTQNLPQVFRSRVVFLVEWYPGLVHLPAAMVGSPMPRVPCYG